jgi:hypothetical protein
LNFHIGIDDGDAKALLTALRLIQRRYVADRSAKQYSTGFVIPYPPGVPLLVPGEEINVGTRQRLLAAQAAGARIFTLEP